jgi:hypothetical protein
MQPPPDQISEFLAGRSSDVSYLGCAPWLIPRNMETLLCDPFRDGQGTVRIGFRKGRGRAPETKVMVEVEGDTGSGERRHHVERRISTGGVGFVGGGFLATGRRRDWVAEDRWR